MGKIERDLEERGLGGEGGRGESSDEVTETRNEGGSGVGAGGGGGESFNNVERRNEKSAFNRFMSYTPLFPFSLKIISKQCTLNPATLPH